MSPTLAIVTNRAVVGSEMRPAAIVVDDGHITDVVDPDDVPSDVAVDDVGDHVVMPGLIDAHVHVNEPGRTHWEGFETATKAACAGGITTIIDMPLNSSPVTTTVEALHQKLEAARKKLWVDCGFYGGLVPGNAGELEALIDAGVLGIKTFLCHSGIDEFPNATPGDLNEAMPILAERRIPLLAHAELVDDDPPSIDDPRDYAQYAASRPPRWERRAIELLVQFCAATGCPVHIVHLAAADALPVLRAARGDGLPVSVETCPHYLLFAAEDIPDADPRYKCAPPIRDRENRQMLRRALEDWDIDMVATDHSPSPPKLKHLDTGDIKNAWGGIASLQLLLPAVWTAMRNRGATPVDIARWTSTRPARLVGLDDQLGAIAPGQKAHLVAWDPEATFTVDAERLHHRHRPTPYAGRTLHGVVQRTYLSGRCVFDGELTPTPQGQPILRHNPSDGATP